MQLYELSKSELTVDRVRSMLPDSDDGIRRAIPLVQEMVAAVRARSERAETRAAVVLGATGIFSGLVVGFATYLKDPNINGWYIFSGLFFAALVLLLKAILFGLRAIDAFKGLELSPEAGIELSGMTERDAERAELAYKVWEYYQLLFVSNSRLYYSQRSQKNFAFAVLAMVVTALFSLLLSLKRVTLPLGWEIAISLSAVLVSLTADYLIERVSKFWKWFA